MLVDLHSCVPPANEVISGRWAWLFPCKRLSLPGVPVAIHLSWCPQPASIICTGIPSASPNLPDFNTVPSCDSGYSFTSCPSARLASSIPGSSPVIYAAPASRYSQCCGPLCPLVGHSMSAVCLNFHFLSPME